MPLANGVKIGSAAFEEGHEGGECDHGEEIPAGAGFADNPVMRHGKRATGGEQGTFIGGEALPIPAIKNTSLFPGICNED